MHSVMRATEEFELLRPLYYLRAFELVIDSEPGDSVSERPSEEGPGTSAGTAGPRGRSTVPLCQCSKCSTWLESLSASATVPVSQCTVQSVPVAVVCWTLELDSEVTTH